MSRPRVLSLVAGGRRRGVQQDLQLIHRVAEFVPVALSRGLLRVAELRSRLTPGRVGVEHGERCRGRGKLSAGADGLGRMRAEERG